MKRQGSQPIPMMDRDTADDLPAHQVEYFHARTSLDQISYIVLIFGGLKHNSSFSVELGPTHFLIYFF